MYPLKTGKMSVYFPVKADNSLYHIIAFHHIIESNQNDIKISPFQAPRHRGSWGSRRSPSNFQVKNVPYFESTKNVMSLVI